MKLTDCIVNHVFDNLGITLLTKTSFRSPLFKLQDSIEYDDENHALLYGAEIKIENSMFRMLLADFSEDETYSEYAMVMKLEGCPSYGCYLRVDGATGDPEDGLICFSNKSNVWFKSNVGIQATFLAGMENLRDVNATWNKLSKTTDLIEELKSFFEYQNDINNKES